VSTGTATATQSPAPALAEAIEKLGSIPNDLDFIGDAHEIAALLEQHCEKAGLSQQALRNLVRQTDMPDHVRTRVEWVIQHVMMFM
jgi:hypothetical protein